MSNCRQRSAASVGGSLLLNQRRTAFPGRHSVVVSCAPPIVGRSYGLEMHRDDVRGSDQCIGVALVVRVQFVAGHIVGLGEFRAKARELYGKLEACLRRRRDEYWQPRQWFIRRENVSIRLGMGPASKSLALRPIV